LVKSNKKQNPLVGLVCGLVAGGLAGAAMDCYWWAVQKLPGERPEQKPKAGEQQKSEPSTQIIADKVSKALTGREVPEEDKPSAGIAVHYATSVVSGGVLGLAASRWPRLGLLGGLAYGTVLWLFLDEIILRVLNVAPDPEKVPTKEHIQALGAHLVYGSTAAIGTRLMLDRVRNT